MKVQCKFMVFVFVFASQSKLYFDSRCVNEISRLLPGDKLFYNLNSWTLKKRKKSSILFYIRIIKKIFLFNLLSASTLFINT